MKDFFYNFAKWCKTHLWQTTVIAIVIVGIVATSILLPITLNKANIADKVIYGNVITMDESNPYSEGVAIKNGKIIAVGNKNDIAKCVDDKTLIESYDDAYIYPGFVDTHSHYAVMSNILCGGPLIEREIPGQYKMGDLVAYAKEIKKFIDQNPNKEVYQAYGMWVMETKPTAEILDTYCCKDKPVVVVGAGGHDCWLNTAAIKKYVGNFEGTEQEKVSVDNWIKEVNPDCVTYKEIDSHMVPTGYFCETARFRITDNLPHTIEEIKELIIYLQNMSFEKGYTTVGDCTIVETATNQQVSAFKQLEEAGELKIKFRSYYEIREYDSKETRDEQLQYAIDLAKQTKNNDYFQIIGIKVFLDGVYEALSSFTLKPHSEGIRDDYHGIQRWYNGKANLDNELKELVYKANKAGLAMEFHAMGDGAVRQALDACEYSNNKLTQEGRQTFKYNAISHLGYVNSNDLNRFKELGVTAVVAPQWAPGLKSAIANERKVLGVQEAEKLFPIKSLLDTGANVAFHTDGSKVNAPEMIYSATTRSASNPEDADHVRGENEKITALDSLKCLTINAAYPLKSAHNLGCIKEGYFADFSIYAKDYRDNVVATTLPDLVKDIPIALISNGKTMKA